MKKAIIFLALAFVCQNLYAQTASIKCGVGAGIDPIYIFDGDHNYGTVEMVVGQNDSSMEYAKNELIFKIDFNFDGHELDGMVVNAKVGDMRIVISPINYSKQYFCFSASRKLEPGTVIHCKYQCKWKKKPIIKA